MNKSKTPDSEMDALLVQTLKDDLPADAEARMKRQFLGFRNSLESAEQKPAAKAWFWMYGQFWKEAAAFASAAMIFIGIMLQPGISQTALAHSIERLKILASIADSLSRVSSMDCAVLAEHAEGKQNAYHIRWHAIGDARINKGETETAPPIISRNPDAAIADERESTQEFLSTNALAKSMIEGYGLTLSNTSANPGTTDYLLVGREGKQRIEIVVDPKTYLPQLLEKCLQDSNRMRERILEARFLWNQPVSSE